MQDKVRDLRSALKRLKQMEGQYIETDVEVDPMAELAGVYRYVGAGGTVKRPTKEPSLSICLLKILTQVEWKVLTQICSAPNPTRSSTLSLISFAALFVNVIAII